MIQDDNETPNWLIETQNKSWEPEILISGITLTFIFILSNQLYNFCAMLIQNFAVSPLKAHIFYGILLVGLTGLKMILIVHLILRGFWAGLVGLSSVFPKGVDKEKMAESDRHRHFDRPVEMVIKVERVCSLLFSFIFSSLYGFFTLLLAILPAIFLHMFGMSLSLTRILLTIYAILLPTTAFLVIVVFKNSRLSKMIVTSPIINIRATFMTNIGRKKVNLIFFVYFLIIIPMTVSDIRSFTGFWNKTNEDELSRSGLIELDKENYEDERDSRFRIHKATVDRFRVDDDSFELFISYYKYDEYTVEKIENDYTTYWKFLSEADSTDMYVSTETDSTNILLSDLYQVKIDSRRILGLKWYLTENIPTGQKGLVTTIPLDGIESGYHELKIEKTIWSNKDDGFILKDRWEIIPFEKQI